MMSAVIVAASLCGSQAPAQQPPQQPTKVAPTVAAPKTPPAPQPAATRPPAEQLPAPTPTPTTPAPAPPAPAITAPDAATAMALLDRIEKIVEEALAGRPSSKTGAVGTSGSLESRAGKVTIDRAALDEIRAEVSLLKAMLHR